MTNYKNIQKILLVFICLTSTFLFGQVKENSELFKTIISKDSLLFNLGFNTCDISQFEELLSDNLEFNHDKDGISDKKEILYNLKNGLCSSPDKYQSRRELIKSSTGIYSLYKNDTLYGVIQNGTHRFYESIAGEEENFASSAKFTNVWLLGNGQWKLTKSLSYDHQTNFKDYSFLTDSLNIDQQLKEHNLAGFSLVVFENYEIVYTNQFGLKSSRSNEIIDKNTAFSTASISKPITALLCIILEEKGLINLDDPIDNYLKR